MRQFGIRPVGLCLPGYEPPKTYAAWPVWKDSTRARVRYQPVPQDARRRWYLHLCEFEGQTRQPGRENGVVSRVGLRVAEVMAFRFLNLETGQLDPSYAAIAEAAKVCLRTVANAVQRLRAIGALHWIRRCHEGQDEAGQYRLEQDSNAYAMRPPSQWRGYTPKPEAPPPDPESWGAVPVMERAKWGDDPEYDLIEVEREGGSLAGVQGRWLRQRIAEQCEARRLLECTECIETILP